jgi:squalene-hopene/tetraprenyl-beta-curcumene cyclase
MNRVEVAQFYGLCRKHLLAARDASGVWRGRLSSSALATAVAAFALRRTGGEDDTRAASRGEAWLARTHLPDGSWGDTPVSQGNLSTTLLALACLRNSPGADAAARGACAEAWVGNRVGTFDADHITAAVLAHYGGDRTFSVPILSLCALGGLLGPAPECWQRIPQLPFELAALPRAVFAAVGLPVVSYALPALIALGLVRHRYGPPPAIRWRRLAESAALRRLGSIQPASGGFLEAVPLTGFVAMALAAAGFAGHASTRRCLAFLRQAQRPDGSWPIDSDLATWLTTLSVSSLGEDLPIEARPRIVQWLLDQQYRAVHPYTGAAPGGWAWTDLPGGVPDADDTSGALLALHRLGAGDPALAPVAEAGLVWLLDLANRDGGIPTFCRGWGRLPFDRSCPDITAHALRAFVRWQPAVSRNLQPRLLRAVTAGLAYLRQAQRPNGSWLPLWFGNEAAPDHANPVYGTARVLQALAEVLPVAGTDGSDWVERAVVWMVAAQGPGGGWGGDREVEPSLEETALAISALSRWPEGRAAADRGVEWLLHHQGDLDCPAPIGLYFASLWYYEDLYPRIFATEALREWLARCPAD